MLATKYCVSKNNRINQFLRFIQIILQEIRISTLISAGSALPE